MTEIEIIKTFSYDQVDASLPPSHEWEPHHGPLSKREYFAARALTAIMSGMNGLGFEDTRKECAKIAVQTADALIDALNEGK